MPDPLDPAAYRDLVRAALAEDIGSGDVTTAAIVPPAARATAVLLAKAPAVLAGLDIAREVFAQCDPAIRFEAVRRDGDICAAGDRVASLDGPAAGLLRGERTALNFLQHLTGIATRTRAFVEAAGPALTVLDTRKTLPLFRTLAKYAVRCGGGTNHRAGLYDAILIKDNHVRVAGGIRAAVALARAAQPQLTVEVETQSLDEVADAVAAGADIILVDNLDDNATREAIRTIGGRARVELSGNMTLDRVRRLADSGADFVSIGALTHSAAAADISLEIDVHVR
jgi:nicotinate-nucleotide pyrophosphorylase (carboxylating)